MNNVERALAYFEQGCNCAQAVIMAFGPQYGLDPEQCMKVAAAFGGGLARQGETCGAVSGALMLLGLKYAESPIGDSSAKEEMYARAQDFMQAFTARHGSIVCKALLGQDVSTPEGLQKVHELQLSKTLCTQYVRAAAELFDDLP